MSSKPDPIDNQLEEIFAKYDVAQSQVDTDRPTLLIVGDRAEIQETAINRIKSLLQSATEKAREDQIMKDELSLMDFNIDESKIIQWRLDRLAELQSRLKSKKGDKL